MRWLRTLAFIPLLFLIAVVAGCQAEIARRPRYEPAEKRIYYQRADGLHIPTYSYLR